MNMSICEMLRCCQPAAPVDIRAQAVKAEFADIENLKVQMLSKDELVTEMKRLLKAKVSSTSTRTVVSSKV